MLTKCPACGDKNCTAYKSTSSDRVAVPYPVGPCAECGWRLNWNWKDTRPGGLRLAPGHVRVTPTQGAPRGASMSDEEYAFRSELFRVWKECPASQLRSQLLIFADWLGDRGDPEEAAARADWTPYAHKRHDPKGWHLWSVRTMFMALYGDGCVLAGGGAVHNGRWFLCWPPGYVRFTSPQTHDPRRRQVTVVKDRNILFSTPIDRRHPGGYVRLFHPKGTAFVRPAASARLTVDRDEGLFAGADDSPAELGAGRQTRAPKRRGA